MKPTFPTLLATASLLLGSQLFGQAPPKYRLTFNDEFNSGFRSNKWASTDYHGIRNNSGDYQAQWFSDPDSAPSGYSAYNPFISSPDGTLSIQAMPTPAGVYSGLSSWSPNLPYVSGMMSTAHKFTQRYGYYELRARVPAGTGLWSRFWLLTDDGVWPGEYDVFEILGRDNKPPGDFFEPQVRQTTHYWDALSSHGIDGSSYNGINPLDGEFHTYGFLWKPDSVTWYVDGVPTLTQANRVNIPMYAILDLAVGTDTNWPGKVDSTTPFPAKMEMDYFRVYSNDPSLPSVAAEPGYTPSAHLPGEVILDSAPDASPLPAGWTAGDVGTPDVAGSSTWNNLTGEWMLKGAGNSITGNGQCQFARTTLPGDGAVTASVLNVTESAANDVRAGVTIRANANTGSAEVSLFYKSSVAWPSLNYTTSLTLQSRATNGGTIQETIPVPAIATISNVAPVTLRLIRSGNTITAAYSTDAGATWTTAGAPLTVSMSGTLLAGIAMGGNQNFYQKPARAIFDNVTVGNLTPTLTSPASTVVTSGTLAFTASLINPLTGSPGPTGPITWSVISGGGTITAQGIYTAPGLIGTGVATIKAEMGSHSVSRNIAITLPSPWFMPSLTRTPPGNAGVTSGVWTVVGGGTGVSTTTNQDLFRFIPSVVAGSETMVVRVDSSAANQAGLLFRDFTSTPDNTAGRGARYAGIWRTPTGLQWATRETAGGAAVSRAQVAIAAGPIWLRIVRSGASAGTFTASYSNDGNTWTQLGSPRTFTMTHSALAGLAVASGSASTTASAAFSELSIASRSLGSPTIATAATYPAKVRPGPSRVTGLTGTLSVLGADDGGEANLTYTWSADVPGSVTFSPNGTNSAKNSTATFTRSGTQLLTVTITDAGGLTVINSVSVRVSQTFSSIAVNPATVALAPNGNRQFTAIANDQFGLAMSDQSPYSFTWSMLLGLGSLTTSGLYTAPPTDGNSVIQAQNGSLTSTATITVGSWANAAPTITTAAGATPSPVTGTTAALSALAADDAGESALTYTWAATGPAAVTYSTNGSNTAKNTTATFTQAGSYQLTATVTDSGGLSASSSFNLEVIPTVTSISFSSPTATVNIGGTRQLTASGIDQFGNAIAISPTWNVTSGGGSITSAGLYTAPSTPGTGSALIRATVGASSARTTIIITSPGSILPWTSGSINATPSGSMTLTGADWTATGGGSAGDQWGLSGTGINGSTYSDSFHFISQAVNGDGELIVKLISPGSAAQVGLMVRDTVDKSSRFAGLLFNNQSNPPGLAWISRSEYTYTGLHTVNVAASFPVWLRLVRVGNSISASRSPNRTIWTQVGSTQTITLNSTVLAGFAISSGSATTTATATFSDLTFTPPENTPPSVTAAASATPAPVTGSTTDLSALGADHAGESALSYTWSATGPAAVNFSASGTNAAKNSRATFTAAGTYNISVRVTDQGGLFTTSNTDVIVSQTLASLEIAPATASVTTGATQQFTASGVDQFGVAMTASPTWSVPNGGGSINSAGLYTAPAAVGSGSTIITAAVGTVSATRTVTITSSILPSPWTAMDINAEPAGGTNFSGNEWAAAGGGSAGDQWGLSGTGINGSKYSDSFHFVNQSVSGNGTLMVRLIDTGNAEQAGLMIRETNDSSSRFTGLFHTTEFAPLGLTWMSRSQHTYNSLHNTGVAVTVPVWLRLVRSGDTFTASRRYDGATTWTPIGTQTITLNSTVLVGFVVSSGNFTTTATARFTDLSFTPTLNAAPTIATAAAASQNPVAGTTVGLSTLGADDAGEPELTYTWSLASGPEGVTFTANNTNAAKVSTANFTTSGTYGLLVTATDSQGLSVTSSVTVTVNGLFTHATKVGSFTPTASASVSGGTYTVASAGTLASGSTSDNFYYYNLQVTGDADLTARVVSMSNTSTTARGGIMIRGSMANNAVSSSIYMTAASGLQSVVRVTAGSRSTSSSVSGPTSPHWLKLSRRGATITTFSSTDGSTWTQRQTHVLNSLPSTAFFGLVAARNSNSGTNSVVFNSVSLVRIGQPINSLSEPITLAPYESWMSNFTSLAPSDQSNSADPDGDGVSNLVEFALGGQPDQGADKGYHVQTLEDTDNDGQKELCLTVAIRNLQDSPTFSPTAGGEQTASVDGIRYTIQGSPDLFSTLSTVTEATPPEGLSPLPPGYEYRTFSLDNSIGLTGIGFLRVQIEPTQ